MPKHARVSKEFCTVVYEMVRQIPKGFVMNYGAVARAIGSPNHARQVGYALSALEHQTAVPWWRVIRSDGSIALKGDLLRGPRQKILLKEEDVPFRGDRVDIQQCLWEPLIF